MTITKCQANLESELHCLTLSGERLVLSHGFALNRACSINLTAIPIQLLALRTAKAAQEELVASCRRLDRGATTASMAAITEDKCTRGSRRGSFELGRSRRERRTGRRGLRRF